MPHLVIQHSANIEPDVDMQGLCDALCEHLAATGIFPKGGIRVRAFPASHFAVADRHPDNGFVDLVLRIGTGRTAAEKQRVGEAIMALLEERLVGPLARPHLALSLEIVEIDPELSWRVNTIHPRLRQG